ncbi:bifunctional 3'-5' exonuclease/DNA polymerase [Paeniglutamicibacter psychrophenolicus]|uniref:bifunctional 3'-5' exonuclease/DNA polymerase n=1 Tax=Paeniglutamicibacter psychrophenolicus TaxID=257454 RepID=UPI0027846D36|nr:bifunctional 3'-5' exonuclease/DNA polymerase [Paeniglutamicibacter psychrophenolicus]MDQ0095512.1 DNA polymerase-1 [Paeniglutamicibacter psychrophenolicus]
MATHSISQPEPEAGSATAVVQLVDAGGTALVPTVQVYGNQLPAVVAELEATRRPRWVFDSVHAWYPGLLAAGVRIERAHDVGLVRAILRNAPYAVPGEYLSALGREPDPANAAPAHLLPPARVPENQGELFSEPKDQSGALENVLAEFLAQRAAVPDTERGAKLGLLLAAESAGALIAAEMTHAGVPWNVDEHHRLLHQALGGRVPAGVRPPRMEELAAQLRTLLDAPGLNPDSPAELLKAMNRAGIAVSNTRAWELTEIKHPVIEPLLAYKKIARLATANGYAWVDRWVHDGRFRPEYIVGGVVTGRWASHGGGALQIPHQVRSAVRADPGKVLVVADAAQLEPRILAALSRDTALAAAATARDLYQGIADAGFGGDRAHAKVAMLGAMYGATSGESGRLMPQLKATYPQAVGLVEWAAAQGEAGAGVATFLGRGTPQAPEGWLRSRSRASTEAEQRAVEAEGRSRGRFTRNFIVQGTAAEWALCWMGELRRRMNAGRAAGVDTGELVFFLHDEIMLHVPAAQAQTVVDLVHESARSASELLFGKIPVDFPLTAVVVDSYDQAK